MDDPVSGQSLRLAETCFALAEASYTILIFVVSTDLFIMCSCGGNTPFHSQLSVTPSTTLISMTPLAIYVCLLVPYISNLLLPFLLLLSIIENILLLYLKSNKNVKSSKNQLFLICE